MSARGTASQPFTAINSPRLVKSKVQFRNPTAPLDNSHIINESEAKSMVIANFLEREKRHKKKSHSQQLITEMFIKNSSYETSKPLEVNQLGESIQFLTSVAEPTADNTDDRSPISPLKRRQHRRNKTTTDYRLDDLPELHCEQQKDFTITDLTDKTLSDKNPLQIEEHAFGINDQINISQEDVRRQFLQVRNTTLPKYKESEIINLHSYEVMKPVELKVFSDCSPPFRSLTDKSATQ